MIDHRLPLFLRSDLYSEYKISKLLTSPDPETVGWHCYSNPTRQDLEADAESQRSTIHQDLETNDECQSSTTHHDLETNAESQQSADAKMKLSDSFNLPEINASRSVSTSVSSTELEVPRSPRVIFSKSDAELQTKSTHKFERKVRWHRSLSVQPEALLPVSVLSGMGKAEQFLSTKSGMNALWKFLKGKAGERNLLFWLDAERIKYYNDEAEQQRCVFTYTPFKMSMQEGRNPSTELYTNLCSDRSGWSGFNPITFGGQNFFGWPQRVTILL